MRNMVLRISLLLLAFPSAAWAQFGSVGEQTARRGCWEERFGTTQAMIDKRADFTAIDQCVTKALGYRDPYMARIKAGHWKEWK